MPIASPIKFASLVSLVSLALGLAAAGCGGRTSGLGGGPDGGGGNGPAGFPFTGPSCQAPQLPAACWPCLESSCGSQIGCFTTDCNAYFTCFCACTPGDGTCAQGCKGSLTAACGSCLDGAGACITQSCQAQCTMMGGGSTSGSSTGGGPSGSGAAGSGGGPASSSECAGTVCPGGQALQSCTDSVNGACTAAYYTVGTQRFNCASCTDTTACARQAQMACQ